MIWIVMILTGLANFAVRFSMFSGLRASTLPDWAERYLRYVPTAVLSAIIAAALFLDEAGDIQMWNTTVLAGLIAGIIAILTRSVIFTIITGLGVLWIIG
jgi:branched-subunit amino acid transport protein